MKNKIVQVAGLAFMAIAIFASCNNKPANTSDEASASADSARLQAQADSAKMAQDWENFKADANQKIKERDDSIEALKVRIKKADKKMQAKLNKDVDELKQKNDELKARMDVFKVDTRENWNKFKTGFNADMDTVGQRIDRLFRKKDK